METVTCPTCGAEQDAEEALLGALGRRRHFRCRDCGMEFSHVRVAADEEPLRQTDESEGSGNE